MKYQFIVEGESLSHLIQQIKQELSILTEQEENAQKMDSLMKTKIKSTIRKNKMWTEFDINFLIDNYRKKKIVWIAEALQRPRIAVYQKLNSLYKEFNLPKINNKAKNL